MRSVTVRLEDLKTIILNLGHAGENEHTRVTVDCRKMFEQYPAASASLTVQPPYGEAYPAVIERDGDFVIWDVTDSDLISVGHGEMQLSFTEEPHLAKSYIGKFKVERSIIPMGDAPEPVQNWIDQAQDVLEEVEGAFPTGGTTGQVLAKKSDADRDTEWVDQTGGASGIVNGITTPAGVMNVKDAAAGNVSGLVLTVLPVQAGSGDPAPDNVRAISGRSSVVLKVSGADTSDPDEYTASIPTPPGTVYGGEIDWVNGKLKVTMGIVDMGELNWEYLSSYDCFRANLSQRSSTSVNDYPLLVCEVYKFGGKNTSNGSMSSAPTSTIYTRTFDVLADPIQWSAVYVKDTRYTTKTALETALTGKYLCYELATPVKYDLTGLNAIPLIKGENNLWIDNGQIKSIEYNADTKLYIDTRIAELQALILDS